MDKIINQKMTDLSDFQLDTILSRGRVSRNKSIIFLWPSDVKGWWRRPKFTMKAHLWQNFGNDLRYQHETKTVIFFYVMSMKTASLKQSGEEEVFQPYFFMPRLLFLLYGVCYFFYQWKNRSYPFLFFYLCLIRKWYFKNQPWCFFL